MQGPNSSDSKGRQRETTHNFTLACTQTNKAVLIGTTAAFTLMLLSIDQSCSCNLACFVALQFNISSLPLPLKKTK